MDTLAKVSQCGLCKVDLKGRFVFVDEEIVRLLGASPEELFGHSLIDYLHKDSRELFEHFLQKRNNYESIYETTELQLVNTDGQILSRTAIISLNFVGGNPVNIQIILIPSKAEQTGGQASEYISDQEIFINELFQLSSISDFKSALDLIRQFTKAQMAILYLSDSDRLEPRSVSAIDSFSESVHQVATELQDIHYDVVTQTSEEHFHQFDSTYEYLLNIENDHGTHWLLRVIKGEDKSTDDLFESRAKLVGKVLTKWLSMQNRSKDESNSGEQTSSLDIRFTVGLLDVLQIGALLTDSSGQVIGFNPSLSDMLQVDGEELDLDNLAALLAGDDNRSLQRQLLEAFRDGDGLELRDHDLMLPSGAIGRLRIVRLGDSPGDLQACIVIVPSFVSVRDFVSEPNGAAGQDILTDILDQFPA